MLTKTLMISPQTIRWYVRLTLLISAILAALFFVLAWIFLSGIAFIVAMFLLPVVTVAGYVLIWRLITPRNMYGQDFVIKK